MKLRSFRPQLLLSLLAVTVVAPILVSAQAPANRYVSPAFTDASRRKHVESVLPEIDKLYAELVAAKHLPGLVYGVVLDGQLIHARAVGFANLERKIPAMSDTRFRIASMTKSFVAMAALMLRDAGKLSLDDPVAKHLPEFSAVHTPTADSPPITIRNLMTMTTGLPEDNPWGDRQMELSNESLEKFVSAGLSFSNPPGQVYEYSNLGFVLLGKIVSKVSGIRFQDYITQKILLPLDMKDTCWEYADVPADKLALGYRWEQDTWELEPILHDGDAAAMGGIITTLIDFAHYVALHLNAWPARDEPDDGPVCRASVRELQMPRIFSTFEPNTTLTDGKTANPRFSFYGYGLRGTRDKQGVVTGGHGGGLPGYGSNYCFAPEHGIGVMAFSNLRYGPVYQLTTRALNLLLERATLSARAQQVSAILERRKTQVAEMIRSWDKALVAEVTAENFLLDRSLADWTTLARESFAAIGAVKSIGAIAPANQLRGTFHIEGEKAQLRVQFTLTPEAEPKVQELELRLMQNN